MVLIATHGTASVQAAAERGTVDAVVEVTGTTRGAVVGPATAAHRELAARAERAVDGGGAVDWAAPALSVWATDEWEPRDGSDGPGSADGTGSADGSGSRESRQVRRFHATVPVTVTFQDIEALSVWVSDAATLEHVSIRSVRWALTPETARTLDEQVRASAALEARARAQAYAAALGLGPVRLRAIYEEGLRPGVTSAGGPIGQMRAFAAAADSGAVLLRPEPIGVTATISADFEADE